MTGLFILFLYVSFFRDPLLLPPLLLILCWSIVLEFIEMKNKKCAYFADFWNYFDIFRFVFAFTYFGVALGGTASHSTMTVLLTLLSFFQSVKAFQRFSLFKSTRVLLRIVI